MHLAVISITLCLVCSVCAFSALCVNINVVIILIIWVVGTYLPRRVKLGFGIVLVVFSRVNELHAVNSECHLICQAFACNVKSLLHRHYLFYLLFRVYKGLNWERNELIHLVFMSVVAVACLIMPLVYTMRSDQWFIITIEVELFLYYVFLLQRFTKHDSLTSLLNRQCYYADIDKYGKSITALIAIDMNGLKTLNDTMGHAAGDEALLTLALCFHKSLRNRQFGYRIGGDEFVILCRKTSKEDVKELIKRIEDKVGETKYNCAIGYSYREDGKKSIEDMLKEADMIMYAAKERYYTQSGKSRRKT